SLFRVIGAGGVTRGRTDAPIVPFDQILVGQFLAAAVTPFFTDSLVQIFGKSFRQAIGQGLRHDRVVVVVFRAESLADLLQADAAGDREGADVIWQPRFYGCDEIGQ